MLFKNTSLLITDIKLKGYLFQFYYKKKYTEKLTLHGRKTQTLDGEDRDSMKKVSIS